MAEINNSANLTGEGLKEYTRYIKSLINSGGSGSGGVSNYNDLTNIPKIESVELTGNKTANELGLAKASDVPTVDAELSTTSYNTVQNKVVATAINSLGARVTTLESSGGGSSGGGGTTTQLIDVDTTWTLGGLQLENGGAYPNSKRIYTDFIEVQEEDSIVLSAEGDGWSWSGCYYTSNTEGSYSTYLIQNNWNDMGTYLMPGAGYIRLAFRQGGYSGTDFSNEDGSINTESFSISVKIKRQVSSGGGTTNYNDLSNKPSINGVVLSGNKTAAELGITGGGSSFGTYQKVNIIKLSNDNCSASGNDVFIDMDVEPDTDYVFDCGEYSWVGVQVGETMYGHTGWSDHVIEFNSGSNTTVKCQFYPGFAPGTWDNANIDYSQVKFYKKDGDTFENYTVYSKQDKLTAGTGIKITDNVISATSSSSGGSGGLISCDISDLVRSATSTDKLKITLVGDSITQGYSASDQASTSWAALMKSYLETNYNVTVVNSGISGNVSTDLVNALSDRIDSDSDVVLCMFGTNNRRGETEMNALYGDYTTIKEHCDSIGAKFIPACCTAETLVNESITAKYVATMDKVGNILNAWAKDNGYELLNLYEELLKYCNYDSSVFDTLFNQSETTKVDGTTYPFHIHPTDKGHYIMFRLILEKLHLCAPIMEFTGVGVGGGSGKYRHYVTLFRKNYYYIDLTFENDRATAYTDSADGYDLLRQDLITEGFGGYSYRTTLQATGMIRATTDDEYKTVYAIFSNDQYASGSGSPLTIIFTDLTSGATPIGTLVVPRDDTASKIWDQVTVGGSGGSSSGGSDSGSAITSIDFPCASGFSNFSTNSKVVRQANGITFFQVILTVNSACNANALLGTIPTPYRPSSTNVLPAIIAYESSASPMAAGVNVNSDGTVRYYGDSLAENRHIIINGSYMS